MPPILIDEQSIWGCVHGIYLRRMEIFTPKLIALLVGLTIVLIGYALTMHKSSVDARFENLKKSQGMTRYLAVLGQETVKVLPDRIVHTSRVKEGSITARIRRAGNPWGINATEFVVLKIGCAVAGIVLGGVCYLAVKDYVKYVPWFVFILAFGALGYIFPDHTLSKKEEERVHAFRKELPRALDLLVISSSVSNSMESSFQTITPLLQRGIVRDEFEVVCKDLAAGRGLTASLTNLAERAPTPEIEAFVNVIIQAQTTGSDMTEALRRRSKTSRQEFIAMLDQKIASLETRIMAVLMPTMVMALTVVAVAPSLQSILGSLGGF